MPDTTPKTIEIFLPNGDPRGIRSAEITTRIVRAIEVPRALLPAFLQMPESDQVGLYFLFGQSLESDPELYIGQTGTLRDRLKLHEKEKAFWNRAVVIVTLTNRLTQTHALFLEWRAINEAKSVGRYSLVNGNAGGKPYTPAPLEAECVEIYETTRMLLATLGHPVFEPLITKQPVTTEASNQQQIFFCKASGAEGRGVFTQDGFVVLHGSSGRKESVTSIKGTTDDEYREKLIADQVVRVEGDRIIFMKDHLVGSPSRAAMALSGRTANGWQEWKTVDGRTADELIRQRSIGSKD